MKLILMRHAKSAWDNHRNDIDRPLNARGRKAAVALGDWLRTTQHEPELALVSAAKRTQETWDLLALGCPVQFKADLYLAPPSRIIKYARMAKANCVLILAHSPGIAELAAELVNAAPLHDRFMDYPTGATLVVETTLCPGSGVVIDFVVPKDLA